MEENVSLKNLNESFNEYKRDFDYLNMFDSPFKRYVIFI